MMQARNVCGSSRLTGQRCASQSLPQAPVALHSRPSLRLFKSKSSSRGAQQQCQASTEEAAGKPAAVERQIEILLFNRTVGARTYFYLELVVLLVQLGLLDAAYSGDWSRIGVISKELEGQLQLLVQFIVVAHSALGLVAVGIAQGKPWRNPALVGLQGFLFGSMAVYELWQDQGPQDS